MAGSWLCPTCGPIPDDVSCGSHLAPEECVNRPPDDAPCAWCGVPPAENDRLRDELATLRERTARLTVVARCVHAYRDTKVGSTVEERAVVAMMQALRLLHPGDLLDEEA